MLIDTITLPFIILTLGFLLAAGALIFAATSLRSKKKNKK